MPLEQKPFFVTLPDRALIRLTGPDRHAFMQALVSNDMDLLKQQHSLYTCLLTPQGKFLFDFIIFEDGEALILDCEGGERAEALLQKLKKYKLRSKVELTLDNDIPLYALLSRHPGEGRDPSSGQVQTGNVRANVTIDPGLRRDDDKINTYCDPRHPALGTRTLHKPENLEERPFSAWDSLRIRLGVPDGSRDMVPEQSTLIECNIDRFHGVSFDKGCYIGQELTARMHHRGLAKKHLYAVEWEETPPAPGTDIQVNGQLAGQARSSCGQIGLALLKDELAGALQNAPFALLPHVPGG